tara:strand:+ start:8487 stop:9185 length:699 start_codon:yes stop_codon:yes gene_type:complete
MSDPFKLQAAILFLAAFFSGTSLIPATGILFANDPPPEAAVAEKTEIEKAESLDQEKNPAQKKEQKKKELDQKLPVESIIEEMKRAGKLLEKQQTGQETQKIQKQVVDNIEELIRLIESAPKSSMKQPNPNQNQQQSDEKKNQQGKDGMGQKNAPQPSQGPARQSSDRKETGQATAGSLPDRNAYIKDAWGHLPPAMRQQLLNIYTEKFLPQYEDQVRRYYEALAEKKKRSP